MAAKWMDEGKTRVLQILLGSQAVDGTLYLGLYKNSTEPAETVGLLGLTEVTVGNGYARKALARGSWVVTDDLAEYVQQIWIALSDWGNVYGYFLATTNDDSGKLLAIEHFEPLTTLKPARG